MSENPDLPEDHEEQLDFVPVPCLECGEDVDVIRPRCSDCMDFEIQPPWEAEVVEMIEADEVREVMEELRDRAHDRRGTKVADVYHNAALMLEELVEDSSDTE